jgi:hypothetical protein
VPLLNRPEVWRQKLVDLLVQGGQPASERQGPYGETLKTTPFGGIFYLLPLFMEIALDGQIGSAGDADGVTTESILRLLIISKAYGCQEAVAVARDPLVQALCGIPPGILSRSFLAEWQHRIAVTDLERIARHVTLQAFDDAGHTDVKLVLKTVGTKKGAVTVLLDADRAAWLWAVRAGFKQLDLTMQKVKQTVDEWPSEIRLIACDAHYYQDLKSMAVFDRVLDLSASRETSIQERQFLAPVLHYVDSLGEELDHLGLQALFGISQARDRAISAIAQAYLRRFAWQLPGFSLSTVQYLAHNMLDCHATLEQESGRHIVRLSRPSLNLLLNMCGLNRREFTLPWFDSRPIMVFPSEGGE